MRIFIIVSLLAALFLAPSLASPSVSFKSSLLAHQRDMDDMPSMGGGATEDVHFREVDSLTRAHIALMILTFGFLLPINILLAKQQSRLQPLVQLFILSSTILALVIQGVSSSKKGQAFAHSFHGKIGLLVLLGLALQTVASLSTRCHLSASLPSLERLHKNLGVLLLYVFVPVVLYSGVDSATGMCGDVAGGLNNCIGHSLVPYAFILAGVYFYYPVFDFAASQPLPTRAIWPFSFQLPFEVAESIFIMMGGLGYFIGCLATELYPDVSGGFFMRGFEHLFLSISWILFGIVGLAVYRLRHPYLPYGVPIVLASVVHSLGFFAHSQHAQFSMLTHWASGIFTFGVAFFRFRRQFREVFFCCILSAAFLACSTSGVITLINAALPELPSVAWLMCIFGVVVGYLTFLALAQSFVDGTGASLLVSQEQYSKLSPRGETDAASSSASSSSSSASSSDGGHQHSVLSTDDEDEHVHPINLELELGEVTSDHARGGSRHNSPVH